MITEAQRRALFALREALNLCVDARIILSLNEEGPGMVIEAQEFQYPVHVYLVNTDIDTLLAEHPE
jgi:hypothetical protein